MSDERDARSRIASKREMREKVKLIFVRAWAFIGLFFSFPFASAALLPLPTIPFTLSTCLPPLRLRKVSSAYLAGSWYPWYVNPANRWLYEMVRGDQGCLGDPDVFRSKKDQLLSLSSSFPFASSVPRAWRWYRSFFRSDTSPRVIIFPSADASVLSECRQSYHIFGTQLKILRAHASYSIVT